jgi:hypothetical protein
VDTKSYECTQIAASALSRKGLKKILAIDENPERPARCGFDLRHGVVWPNYNEVALKLLFVGLRKDTHALQER